LHLGDVLITENDVFGDGVNVAARIEPLAEPGGICVSDEFYMMIRKRVEVTVEQLDNPSLKNISTSTRVYRVNLRLEA
jgi:adenylate cyclase